LLPRLHDLFVVTPREQKMRSRREISRGCYKGRDKSRRL
jgi:hypothetical protein